jgi:hypothetical protein
VTNDLAWADLDILALQQRAFLMLNKPRQDFVASNGNFRASAYDFIPYAG